MLIITKITISPDVTAPFLWTWCICLQAVETFVLEHQHHGPPQVPVTEDTSGLKYYSPMKGVLTTHHVSVV